MNRLELDMYLKNKGYLYDHVSTVSGYVSRKKEFEIKPYVGRFGLGVKVLVPRHDTSRYVYCMYYILDCSDIRAGIMWPEIVSCEFANGSKMNYEIISYKIGKYDITLTAIDGCDIVMNKRLLKSITTRGVERLCSVLNCYDQ